MSTNLARRVRAIERQHATRPPDPATLCPVAWTARFEAYRPENAAIMAAARGYPTTRNGEHVGDVALGLCLEAGFDARDGKIVTPPPSPTAEEAVALGLLEDLLAAVKGYVSATGDRFPRAIFGLG